MGPLTSTNPALPRNTPAATSPGESPSSSPNGALATPKVKAARITRVKASTAGSTRRSWSATPAATGCDARGTTVAR